MMRLCLILLKLLSCTTDGPAAWWVNTLHTKVCGDLHLPAGKLTRGGLSHPLGGGLGLWDYRHTVRLPRRSALSTSWTLRSREGLVWPLFCCRVGLFGNKGTETDLHLNTSPLSFWTWSLGDLWRSVNLNLGFLSNCDQFMSFSLSVKAKNLKEAPSLFT